MLNRDFTSGKAKPNSEEKHNLGRDSLSANGWNCVRLKWVALSRCKTIPISNQLEAEHEY